MIQTSNPISQLLLVGILICQMITVAVLMDLKDSIKSRFKRED